MSIARQLHATLQRARLIREAATLQCSTMRGDRSADLFEFTFRDGSTITLERNRVSMR
uniref:Uncharacterized protein n=1 Tax=Pseudomonas phage Touem01 TaxID=3138548 RepID=A0AAU6W2S0_9VIRU